MRKTISYTALLLFPLILCSQEKNEEVQLLNTYRDSLKVITNKLYSSTTDSSKLKTNEELLVFLNRMIKQQGSYEYSFETVKDIGILTSPDGMFRIYNWNVPLKDGTHQYYGFIHKKQIQTRKVGLFKKITTERYEVFELNDVSDKISNPENYVSDNKRWYGMLYYSIIPKKSKNKKTAYTLLGWDGNDNFSKKKIIDVLTFNNKGLPVFGGSIFNTEKGLRKKVVFEYNATCTMTLKYDVKKDSIVFDHLVPTEPHLEGQHQYYCTDFTYDGYGFKNGRWNFGELIHATNNKNEKDKLYKNPKETEGAIKSNEIIQKRKSDDSEE